MSGSSWNGWSQGLTVDGRRAGYLKTCSLTFPRSPADAIDAAASSCRLPRCGLVRRTNASVSLPRWSRNAQRQRQRAAILL
mmetsp:Transcript_52022/g.110595  ORF Transcript_52022/g.110595 Transcript_52022/m.110595 type:complete len:81 (-) Transcript_52022:187-429(-)